MYQTTPAGSRSTPLAVTPSYPLSSESPAMHEEFPHPAGLIHLNHAGVAPWPRRTVAAVTAFAQENWAPGPSQYPLWLATEDRLREALARLIQAPGPDDIALVKNTSEALSLVAQGLSWRRGDNLVGIAQEFPSNRLPWEALAAQGVETRWLDLYASQDPEADLIALCDAHTRLMSVSSVQYARGLRLNLERLGAFCRPRGILLCLDAIQQLGALPFDLGQAQADFVAADGHKWLLGAEGLALFYVRAEIRDQLRLTQFGWHMVERSGDFEAKDWRPASSARRFECGSPNLIGIHALAASLSLLEEQGMEQVAARIRERTDQVLELVDRRGWTLLSSRDPERRSGIVTFAVPGQDPVLLYRGLMAAGVSCAPRGGGVRFSPHFYTDPDRIQTAFQILDRLIQAGPAPAALAGATMAPPATDL